MRDQGDRRKEEKEEEKEIRLFGNCKTILDVASIKPKTSHALEEFGLDHACMWITIRHHCSVLRDQKRRIFDISSNHSIQEREEEEDRDRRRNDHKPTTPGCC